MAGAPLAAPVAPLPARPLAAPLAAPTAGPLLAPESPTPTMEPSGPKSPAVSTRPGIPSAQAQRSQAPFMLIVGAVAVAVLLVGLVVAMNSGNEDSKSNTQVAANSPNTVPTSTSSGAATKPKRSTSPKTNVKPRKTTVAIENDEDSPGMNGDDESDSPPKKTSPKKTKGKPDSVD